MRRGTQKLAPLFVVLMAALLAFPSLFNFQRNPVSAFAQDASKAEAKPKVKQKKMGPRVIKGAPPPANDNCANAIAVATCPFTDTRDTTGASDETGEPQSTCTVQGNSVWYTYVNNSNNLAIVNVDSCGSSFDTAMMVYRVDPTQPCNFASFTPIACNDDTDTCTSGDGFESALSFNADPGASYKIQAGGFDGETGSLTVNVNCRVLNCDPIDINGTLGSGDPNFGGVQSSGAQIGQFNRSGIASSCASPKTCNISASTELRTYDAYQIPNASGEDQCVSINLNVLDEAGCNLESIAYLDTYDPNDICTGYLGDPGLSSGTPPTPTTFSVVVPAGHTLIVVVYSINLGGTGCDYTLTVLGDLCVGFDACVQNDNNPNQFILLNSETGAYEYHDCSKGVVLTGVGVITRGVPNGNCKLTLSDSGPIPKRPDRAVFVDINTCTHVGSASIRFPRTAKTATNFTDSNTENNNCVCP